MPSSTVQRVSPTATKADKVIGRVVALLRLNRTQQEVADAMRERGWRWSQATVWAVEKGDRPLRLAEARDLAEILQVPLIRLLEPPDAPIAHLERSVATNRESVAVATRKVEVANHELANAHRRLFESERRLADVQERLRRGEVWRG